MGRSEPPYPLAAPVGWAQRRASERSRPSGHISLWSDSTVPVSLECEACNKALPPWAVAVATPLGLAYLSQLVLCCPRQHGVCGRVPVFHGRKIS